MLLSKIKANPNNPRLIKDDKFIKNCVVCNTIFKTKPCHYERRRTCSMKCRGELLKLEQSGINHPLYKNGKAVKKQYTCQKCSKLFISDKGYEGREIKFCSKTCAAEALKIKKPIKQCNHCGNDFEVKYHQGLHKFCSLICAAISRGAAMKGQKRPDLSGENSSAWRGGITPINEAQRKSTDYKQWRIKVFERDNYTCVKCNKKGQHLHADHIKPFAYFVELRFDINNGQTLCVDCHKKTDTYGSKAKKYERKAA